jgi:hypothetical protein
MMLLAGSALSALDALKSLRDLVSPGSSSSTTAGTAFGVSDTTTSTATSTSSAQGTSSTVSPDTMRALLALQAKSSGTGNLSSQLFARLDRDGNGRISKTEFDKVASSLGSTSQTNSLFDSLDSDDDGEIGGNELDAALKRQSLPATQTVSANASTQELFQRLLQQHNDMLTTMATGQTVARAI